MQRLKAWAEPLVDSADSALAKALDAAERYREIHTPTATVPVPRSGDHASGLPEETVREPLMDVIYERGGSASGREVYPALRERVKRYMTPGDFDRISAGDDRWRSTVKSAREDLVQEGYLRDDSPRGVWALSDAGVALVESRRVESSGSFVDHLLAFPDVGEDSDFDQPRSSPRPVDL